jgi:predicted PurR-regulated permease PerM
MARRLRLYLLIAAAGTIVFFLFLVRDILTPFLLAAALAYLANPLVNAFERREIPRSLAIILVYTVFVVAAVLTIYGLIPAWTRELNAVLLNLPLMAQQIERSTLNWVNNLVRLPGSELLKEVITVSIHRGEMILENLSARVLDSLLGLFPRAFNLVLAPFLAYYLLRDQELIRTTLLSLVPHDKRHDVQDVLREVNRVIAGFLRGQIIVSIFVGSFIGLALLLLQVDYALLIGAFAGLLDIIPYFGPIIGAIPAVALALLKSPVTALWVIVAFVAANQIESMVLQPRIVGGHVGLHPLTVIFAILAGGKLLGIWGMLVAVPLTAAIKVLANYGLDKLISSNWSR